MSRARGRGEGSQGFPAEDTAPWVSRMNHEMSSTFLLKQPHSDVWSHLRSWTHFHSIGSGGLSL